MKCGVSVGNGIKISRVETFPQLPLSSRCLSAHSRVHRPSPLQRAAGQCPGGDGSDEFHGQATAGRQVAVPTFSPAQQPGNEAPAPRATSSLRVTSKCSADPQPCRTLMKTRLENTPWVCFHCRINQTLTQLLPQLSPPLCRPLTPVVSWCF